MTEDTFEQLGVPTRAAVEAVWNQMTAPSSRKVAILMRRRGWKISAKTVSRWFNEGFKEPKGKKSKIHPESALKVKRKAAEAADNLNKMDELKSDPAFLAALEALGPPKVEEEFETSKFPDLMRLSKEALKEKLDKTTMACGIMMGEAVIRHRDALAGLPKDIGAFLCNMGEVAAVMSIGDDIPPHANGAPGDGAIVVINGSASAVPAHPVVENPVSNAILEFKKKAGVS